MSVPGLGDGLVEHGCAGWGCGGVVPASAAWSGRSAGRGPRACRDCGRVLCASCSARRTRCLPCGGPLIGVTRWGRLPVHRPPGAVRLCAQGAALAAEGRSAEALTRFDHAIRARPHYVEARSRRAALLVDRGDPDAALADCDHVLALEPDHPPAWYDRATALTLRGHLPEAVAAYDEAVRRCPRFLAAHVNRAVAVLELGEAERALRLCDEAARLLAGPGDVEGDDATGTHLAGARGACLLVLDRPEEALDALDAAIGDGPGEPNMLRNRALALLRLGRHEEARVAALAARRKT
ncbi:tetratricopeptide repeat protein [Actinosynnema pretiosum]|uniref:tetratricopeptide repeat protein n=1 Tax=Actinosynnema pretiosum TaxID=42197 RepID=UPI0015A57EEA|nr:tetratricopeptide repeat protein [Actinosynnema pretiosum]